MNKNLRILLSSIAGIGVLIIGAGNALGATSNQTPSDAAANTPAVEAQSNLSIDQAIASENNLRIFSAIAKIANLDAVMSQNGPYTIFAPTDDAIKALPQNIINNVSTDRGKISMVINNHIVRGMVSQQDINNPNVTSIAGNQLQVTQSGSSASVNGQRIVKSIPFKNGVIYEIDGLILPPNVM